MLLEKAHPEHFCALVSLSDKWGENCHGLLSPEPGHSQVQDAGTTPWAASAIPSRPHSHSNCSDLCAQRSTVAPAATLLFTSTPSKQ